MIEAIKFLANKYGLTDNFLRKNAELATWLNVNPEHLLTVYYIESRFNPKAVNPLSNATGIIQWMPSTAQWLGTTTAYLKTLTAEQQLDWVKKYMAPYRGRMKNIADVYLAVFFPAAIGKPDNYVLQTSSLSAERIAKWNPAYDLNKDNKLTKGEVKQKITEIASSIGLKKKITIGIGGLLLTTLAIIGYRAYTKKKTKN